MRDHLPQLSKSRYLAGLQCSKRLYLECYHHAEKDPLSSGQQSHFDSGSEVGLLAQQYFPGGKWIAEDHLQHEQAIASTRAALAEASIPSLYEAAFLFDDIKIRVDILHKHGAEYDLIEVKSSTKVKNEHLDDLAIQVYVLSGLGIKIRKCFLMHINSGYLYQGGAYQLAELFHLQELTEEIAAPMARVRARLEAMREALGSGQIPSREIGSHCHQPYPCSFYAYCHQSLADDPISQLPKASQKLLQQLKRDGIESIRQIPEGYSGLSPAQRRMRKALVENRAQYDQELFAGLIALQATLHGPVASAIHFLDFETLNLALPAFAGTRPYQQIPFQWSNHVLNAQGSLEHCSFLSQNELDPRRPFAESLIRTLATPGPIVVYSSFEKSCLNALAIQLPDLAGALHQIVKRLVDLYTLIRNHAYHPQFGGSFSIKSVLPALVPALSYQGLAIADGATAANAFAKTLKSQTSASERAQIYADLHRYCHQDTLAMVEIYRTLLGQS